MSKVFVIPQNERQRRDWESRLKDAGCVFEETTYGKKQAFYVDTVDAKDILGLEPNQMFIKFPLITKILMGIVFLAFFSIFAVTCSTCGQEDAKPQIPVSEMTDEQAFEYFKKEYRRYSPFYQNYIGVLKANLQLHDPESFEVREYYLVPIDRDSFTVVMTFAAKNAFNAKIEHSATSVFGADGRFQRLVTFH